MPTHPQRPSRKPWPSAGDDPRIIAELLDRAEAGAERELRQLERNLRLHLDIVRHMQLGLLVWRLDDGAGLDFRLVTANPAAAAIAGIDFDTLVGATIGEVPPDVAAGAIAPRLRARLAGAVHDDEGDASWPLRGSTRVFSIKSFALPERLVALTFDDVTERRAMAERLRQAEKMDTIGRLAGGLAHDFNNVLATIAAAASMLEETLVPGDPRRQDVQMVLDASNRGAMMARRLLAFSRRQPPTPRALDLNGALESLRPLLGRLVGSGIEIRSAPAAQVPRVLADPVEIEQILLNLAVNAQQAMPGGGTLRLSTRASTRGDGAWAELAVSDTGIGMDASTRSRVFEPFFTTKDHGTGLGLATVYGIVRGRGGEIEVDSAPGRGTTFTIVLPACDRAGGRD